METSPTPHGTNLIPNELDPRVQEAIFQKISQEIQAQLRTSLAAFQPAPAYGTANPAAGHAAGSQSDTPTDGSRMVGHRELNFNWGSSLPTPGTESHDVSNPLSKGLLSEILEYFPVVDKCCVQNSSTPKRKRLPSSSPIKESIPDNEHAFSPIVKRCKTVHLHTQSKKLKQTCLTNFFHKTRANESETLDSINVSHLVALDMSPDENVSLTNSTILNNKCDESCEAQRQRSQACLAQTRDREPIILSIPNPAITMSICNDKGEVDLDRKAQLTTEIKRHNLRLFD